MPTGNTRDKFKDSLEELLNDAAEFLLSESQKNLVTPVPWLNSDRGSAAITNSGELLQSGKVEKTPDGYAVVYDAPHASYIEFGTEPHFPPIEPLVKWCRRKLGKSDSEAWAMARNIQRKIGAHGTDPHPFLRPAIEATEKRF